MNIQLDDKSTNKFFNWFATKMFEIMLPKILELLQQHLDADVLLKKYEVCDVILNCDEGTADDHFLNAPGFPYVDFGKKSRRYPKKAVEKWIKDNTKFN